MTYFNLVECCLCNVTAKEPEIGLNDEVFESFRKIVKMTRTRSISFNESDEENISDI